MSEIQILDNPEFGRVRRMIDDEGSLIFCGRDVAIACGHARPNDALMQHCKGAVIYRPLETAGGIQQFRFITEADVIRLIVGSNLPNAQRFEAWLFEDIAPKAVRGELISREELYAELSSPEGAMKIIENWKRDRDRAAILEVQNKAMAPKARFADAVAASDSTILIGELAKFLKQNGIDIGQNRLFAWLREHGYLIRRSGTDYNMPTQKAMELGLFKVKERTHMNPDGTVMVTRTTTVTGKGQQYFINKFLGNALVVA